MEEDIELFEQLMQKAIAGEHLQVELIRNYKQLDAMVFYKRAVGKVAKQFNTMAKALYKQYIKELYNERPVLDTIMQFRQLTLSRDYFLKEQQIAEYIIYEYRTYINSGHLIDFILGKDRPDEDMVDMIKESELWEW